ncbi:CDP-glycerol glycerophosphotransferase family protein [Methanobrevibacter arboriphilus]|uniref:CDP-glycerol glycerophosphotransferase family protein n=1 Tax=Methanobrevibacter arboriphilus TaxID=39441 RepID=UPI002980AE17|nr:CDP-glycerol glycerophosphotransferase family protein [Methanobrevibacter arboriphilus]
MIFFVKDHFKIPNEYKDNIIDIDITEDINDLLFITDILISDYSSVVFEAALLDIPMLFYAFDLENYISERSFYYEYKTFVPGKIIYSQEGIVNSIKNNDFENYKINSFKSKFFLIILMVNQLKELLI